jgi:phosphatidylinositol-3-phosphatase
VRRALGLVVLMAAATLAPAAALAATPTPTPAPAPIHHVFMIVLENEGAATTFGPGSPAPYLSKTLRAAGAYVPNYYGTGHNSNDNYIAMISGQAPNPATQEDCLLFSDFGSNSTGAYGQQQGGGCVYPHDIQTIAGQLSGSGLTWRDYNQSMGADPTRETSVCGHPALDRLDNTETATAQDAYASRHNPFVYFHSIIDSTTLCDTHVVNLDQLPQDLSAAANTPNYVFITPDLCSDGHDSSCAVPGRPGGFPGIEQFLQQWVPKITSSPAFTKQNGLLIITFDEASTTDTSACCGEIAGPGAPYPGGLLSGAGGGNVGAVLLSPCIAPGTVTQQSYNHYTMLRSVEDIFGLGHLGYAQLPGGRSFGSDIFTRPCEPPPVVHVPARAHGRTIRVRWRATDPGGPGVAHYQVQVRTGRRWRTLLRSSTRRALRYRGTRGVRYRFRVRATDKSGIASAFVTTKRVAVS